MHEHVSDFMEHDVCAVQGTGASLVEDVVLVCGDQPYPVGTTRDGIPWQGTDMKGSASLEGEVFGQGLDGEWLRQLQVTQKPPTSISQLSRHSELILIVT
ncbi:MAG: hypothetical protein ACRDRS_23870 [Pseudonocardiaceae bacterium]